MGTITTTDGTEIFYKDWGTGRPVVFSHGWPLNADAWDDQMHVGRLATASAAIAHDRRGHGRSGQPWHGNDMDTYADDLAQLIEALDLRDAVLVGHSTGGGEVARYIGRHGTGRVAKAVLLGAVPPLMLKTEANPEGLPMEVFDEIRAGVAADRSQFYKDLSEPLLRRQPARRRPSPRESATRSGCWSMQVGLKGAYDCVKAVLRDRLHRGPQAVRRPDAHRPRRRRPDRADRGRRPEVGRSWSRTPRSRSTRVRRTASRRSARTRTTSTPTCWRSSTADGRPPACGPHMQPVPADRTCGRLGRHRLDSFPAYLPLRPRSPQPQPPFSQPSLKTGPTWSRTPAESQQEP